MCSMMGLSGVKIYPWGGEVCIGILSLGIHVVWSDSFHSYRMQDGANDRLCALMMRQTPGIAVCNLRADH